MSLIRLCVMSHVNHNISEGVGVGYRIVSDWSVGLNKRHAWLGGLSLHLQRNKLIELILRLRKKMYVAVLNITLFGNLDDY